MADASRSELPSRVALGLVDTWRRLNFEQRAAAVGALLLIISTFGPFSFVEAAIVLVGLSVLVLLRRRAQGRAFHVPFGDGTVIAAAGAWSAALIMIRVFERPLGQGLLALVCAAILLVAGLAERRKHLPDDLPDADAEARQRDADAVGGPGPGSRPVPARRRRPARAATPAGQSADVDTAEHERVPRAPEPSRERLFDPESGSIDELRSVHDAPTEPLPPPEYKPPTRRRSGVARLPEGEPPEGDDPAAGEPTRRLGPVDEPAPDDARTPPRGSRPLPRDEPPPPPPPPPPDEPPPPPPPPPPAGS
jgi:hypothetical protein